MPEKRTVRKAKEDLEERKEPDHGRRRIRSRGDGPHPAWKARRPLDGAGHCHRPLEGSSGRSSTQATTEGTDQSPHAAVGRAGLRGRSEEAEAEGTFAKEEPRHHARSPARGSTRCIAEGPLQAGASGRAARTTFALQALSGAAGRAGEGDRSHGTFAEGDAAPLHASQRNSSRLLHPCRRVPGEEEHRARARRAERTRSERRPGDFVRSHGSPRNSERGVLVVSRRWSGSRDLAARHCSSRRLVKVARRGEADPARSTLLCGATGRLWHRTFHACGDHRLDRTGVDAVASLLGVLHRSLLRRSGIQPGDQDPAAPFGELARTDVLLLRRADGHSGLGGGPARSVCTHARVARAVLQRRRAGARGQPH